MYTFSEIFPEVSVSFLQNLMASHDRDVETVRETCFQQRQVVNPVVRNNAISISLVAPLEYRNLGKDRAAQENWLIKYRDSLLRNLEDFPRLLDPGQWKVMLFTHPESLSILAPELLDEIGRMDFVELHFMANASKSLSPGTLWRFLPFSDRTLDELLILDIDESWEMNINGWYMDATGYNKPFTRAHHIPRPGFWLNLLNPWSNLDGRVNNYLPVMASKILARPRELGLDDVSSLMAAYIVLRKQRIERGFPSTQVSDNEPVTPYNRPYEGMPYGFGNDWKGYCFDERFLAHVIYHHVVARGDMCTYCFEQFLVPELLGYLRKYNLKDFLLDFAYTREKCANNIVVNNGNVLDFPARPASTHHGREYVSKRPDLNIRPAGSVPLPTGKRGILPDVQFHPSGEMFAVTSWAENEIYIYSARSSPPGLIQRIRGAEAGFNSAHSTVFSPSGDKMIVNAYLDNSILVFDVLPLDYLVNPRPIRLFETPAALLTQRPHSMDLTSDGRFLACVYCDGDTGFNKVVVYRLDPDVPGYGFNVVGVLDAKHIEFRNPKGVAFTPCDQGIVISLSDTNNLVLHDFDTEYCRLDPQPSQVLRNPESKLFHPEDLCFTRCGTYCLVTNSSRNTIGFYKFDQRHRRFEDLQPVFSLGGPEIGFNYPHGLDVSPDNRMLLATDYGAYPEPDNENSPRNQPAKILMFEIDLGNQGSVGPEQETRNCRAVT